jgi:dTDP-glucose 4,6-dehydratase/UDP-glucuronate decarboxylase
MIAYVTGAAGFVGSHLVDRLVADGADVVAVDNLITGDVANLRGAVASGKVTFVEADVSQPWTWAATLPARLRRPSHLMHLASPASPVSYGRHPIETLRANSVGTMHAVDHALASAAALVFASTSESYGDPLEHPQRETYWGNVNPVGERACYDESKRFGEAYVSTAVRALRLDGRIARIFNTYGPRMQPGDGRVVPSFCAQALRGEDVTIYGDGTQTRSFCYVGDLVDGLVRLATAPGLRGTIVNLGNPAELTVAELAQVVAELAGVPLRFERRPLPPDDPTRRRPDISRAVELLGWAPRIALREGLRMTLDDVRLRIGSARAV